MRFLFSLLLVGFSALGLKAQDSIPPQIIMWGEPFIDICQYRTYTDAGYEVSDNRDSVKYIHVEAEGTFFPAKTSKPGLFTLRYKASDRAGNIAYSPWRFIRVLAIESELCEGRRPDTTKHPSVILEINKQQSITVYPNPTRGIVNVDVGNSHNCQIRLTDITGKTIPLAVSRSSASSLSFALTGLPAGLYLLHAATGEGEFVEKIYLIK
jgi:hypothetical protein